LLTYSAFFALGELLRQNYAAAAVNALVSATGVLCAGVAAEAPPAQFSMTLLCVLAK
jgi:hypothetical protein